MEEHAASRVSTQSFSTRAGWGCRPDRTSQYMPDVLLYFRTAQIVQIVLAEKVEKAEYLPSLDRLRCPRLLGTSSAWLVRNECAPEPAVVLEGNTRPLKSQWKRCKRC